MKQYFRIICLISASLLLTPKISTCNGLGEDTEPVTCNEAKERLKNADNALDKAKQDARDAKTVRDELNKQE